MISIEERKIRATRRDLCNVRLAVSMWLLGCGMGLIGWKPLLALLAMGLANVGVVRWENLYKRGQ